MKAEQARYAALFSRIDTLCKKHATVNVAIDGNCSAGKTALAALLKTIYPCNVFHMDDFFLPEELKTPARLAEPGGNVHYERFAREILPHLAGKKAFSYHPFDCRRQAPGEIITVRPQKLNIIEGVYSLHPALAHAYHLKVFLAIDPRTQDKRLRKRSGPLLYKRFIEEWLPLENSYFREFRIMEQCHLVFLQN